MFFASKKNRSKIICFFMVLLVCDSVFVHKIHPMALSAVQVVGWCAQLCMAGCAALMQKNNSAHSDVITQYAQASGITAPEKPYIQQKIIEVVEPEPSFLSLDREEPVIQSSVVQSHYYQSYDFDEKYVQQLSQAIAIDWNQVVVQNAQMLQGSLQKVRRQEQDAWAAHYTSPTRVYSNKNYTIAIDTPVGTGYALVRSKAPCSVGTTVQEKKYFAQRVSRDPNFWDSTSTTFDLFISNNHQLIAGDIFDQVLAVFSIGDFAIDDNFMGGKLLFAQKKLWHNFFHKDGSLCVDSLNKRYEAWEIVKEYVKDIFNCSGFARYKDFFNQIKPSKNNTKRCGDLFKKPSRVPDNFAQKIRSNHFNQDIKKMVGALAHGDMQTEQAIKQKPNGAKTLFNLCNKRYTEIVQAYRRSLQDGYGIYRFNDPLYTQLSATEKQQLKKNKNNRDEFNQLLIIRDRFKQSLQQAWNISSTAPVVVHKALYTLLGNDTRSALGNVPLCIDQCIEFVSDTTLSATDCSALNNAFFLRNGIHKDLAQYKRAQSLKMPTKIMDHEFLQVRRLLNHCVYHEHISQNDNVKALALKGIECIEKAFVLSSDKQIQDYLNSSFVELYSQTQKIQETQLAYVFGDVVRNYCDALPENKGPQQDDEERDKIKEWDCGTGKITEIKVVKGVCNSGIQKDLDVFEKVSEISCQPNMNPDSEKESAVCSSGIQEAEPVTTCNSANGLPGFESNKDVETDNSLAVDSGIAEAKEEIIEVVGNGLTAAISVENVSENTIIKRGIYKHVVKSGEKCRVLAPQDEEKAWEWAEKEYDRIRLLTDDIEKIAQNAKKSKSFIERVKDHLFYNDKHILTLRTGLLDPDPEIASAWDRLYHGDFIENDIKLLEHEYLESRLEKLYKITLRKAHDMAQLKKGKPWREPIFEER